MVKKVPRSMTTRDAATGISPCNCTGDRKVWFFSKRLKFKGRRCANKVETASLVGRAGGRAHRRRPVKGWSARRGLRRLACAAAAFLACAAFAPLLADAQ